MKQKNTILITLLLFGTTLLLALSQGKAQGVEKYIGSTISNFVPASLGSIPSLFANGFDFLMGMLVAISGGSVFISLIILALMTELILLYPHLRLQLKQKKIHLFHKKLVNRFESGELSFSKVNQEMDVLYSVNEKIHSKGALIVTFQVIVFLLVLWGLKSFASSVGAKSLVDAMLLYRPTNILIPLFAGVVYFSHSLIKIGIKQKEDYIHPHQTMLALFIALIASAVVFLSSSAFSVLLSVYFVTLISLGTLRYLLVEKYSARFSKRIRHDLIEMLKNAKTNHSNIRKRYQKWIRHPFIRHINFHLLEESASMSFAFLLMINTF